jgi:hypothetical protein
MSILDEAFEVINDDLGIVVTHRPLSRPTFDVSATWFQKELEDLTDNREGRQTHNKGSLQVNPRDVNGNVISIDPQGEFVINGVRWAATNVAMMPGGWLVSVKLIDRKTMRRLPGNS